MKSEKSWAEFHRLASVGTPRGKFIAELCDCVVSASMPTGELMGTSKFGSIKTAKVSLLTPS